MHSHRPPTAPLPISARRPRHLLAVAAGGLLFLSSAALHATVIGVPNFSFESPALADGGFTIVAPPSWVQSGSLAYQTGVFNPQNAQFPGSSGAGNLPGSAQGPQAAFMNVGGLGAVSLTSASLGIIQANTTYTVTAAFGVSLTFPTSLSDLGQFYLGFNANGSTIPGSISPNASLLPVGSFADFTMSFTTGATGSIIGQDLTVALGYVSIANAGNPSGVVVDNIRVNDSNTTTPANTPDGGSTALLLAASCVALLGLKRLG